MGSREFAIRHLGALVFIQKKYRTGKMSGIGRVAGYFNDTLLVIHLSDSYGHSATGSGVMLMDSAGNPIRDNLYIAPIDGITFAHDGVSSVDQERDYPHKCSLCGGPSYIGFNKVDCSNEFCGGPVTKKVNIPKTIP